MKKMNKQIVANREEAMKLIAGGVNPLSITSDEAPHGYKKDGTPAGRRGRKPLAPEVIAQREAAAAAKTSTRPERAKPGPVVRTPDAPYGLKKDGTPAAKRGRIPAAEAQARRAAKSQDRENRRLEREAKKVAKAAAHVVAAATETLEAVASLAHATPLVPVTDGHAHQTVAHDTPATSDTHAPTPLVPVADSEVVSEAAGVADHTPVAVAG